MIVRNLCGVMAKVLDCILDTSEFELQFIVHFWTETVGKGMKLLILLKKWIKLYRCCSFTRMELTLNNP